jgi:hypothetical protein
VHLLKLVKYFIFMKLTLILGSMARSRPEPLKKYQKEPVISKILTVACYGGATLGEMEVLTQLIG